MIREYKTLLIKCRTWKGRVFFHIAAFTLIVSYVLMGGIALFGFPLSRWTARTFAVFWLAITLPILLILFVAWRRD